jgi:alkylation response protein AidB-like acyl-CoA dehydrogenase
MNACRFTAGNGFIKDYPAEKFYRDVKLCTIGGAPAKSAPGDCAAGIEGLR